MKCLFIFLYLVVSNNLLIAQKRLLLDSSTIDVRTFDNNALQEYKNKSEFQYDQLREPARSLWDRFWSWVWSQVRDIMRTRRGRTTVWTLLVLLGVTVIIFFVVKVMGMNKENLFGRSGGKGLLYSTSVEDINQFDFELSIRDAIENRNYRLATRLLYLHCLKQLSDKGYIDWQINKTNTDYINEVSGKPWQSLFKNLTYNFEYIWYGEMNLPNEQFQDLRVQFQQFNNQL